MKMIDKEYETIDNTVDRGLSFQSKLAAYRKETEAQLQTEMNVKVHIMGHGCVEIHEAETHF